MYLTYTRDPVNNEQPGTNQTRNPSNEFQAEEIELDCPPLSVERVNAL